MRLLNFWPKSKACCCRSEIVRWVSESLRPFNIVKDQGFQSLMKTGRPEYYLQSPSTVSRDVRLVFVRTCQRVAKLLQVSLYSYEICETDQTYQEYKGRINFTTNGWSSPNHRAFVAFSAHFEHNREPLCLLLDIIEVAKVGTY
jgi:hypothetical protein